MIFRRGSVSFLGEHGLGVIIAALCLVLLIGFFGVKLWLFFGGQERINASSLIDGLDAKIEALQLGENNTFLIRGIEGWNLIAWNVGEKERPDKCFFENCLCVCPDPNIASCQSGGICRTFDHSVTVTGNPVEIVTYQRNGKSVTEISRETGETQRFISLTSKLEAIDVLKSIDGDIQIIKTDRSVVQISKTVGVADPY